jgi:hypothetical protein
MKLYHFSPYQIAQLEDIDQEKPNTWSTFNKPRGLWVSDEEDYGWRDWCRDENFRPERFKYVYKVELSEDANILYLRSPIAIDSFTREYSAGKAKMPFSEHEFDRGIDWLTVSKKYDGIIITPYQWSRRMEMHCQWYYGWDCASGCIWNMKAIKGVTRVQRVYTNRKRRVVEA